MAALEKRTALQGRSPRLLPYGLTRACRYLTTMACACLALGQSALAAPPTTPASNETARCRWDGSPIWWLHAPKTASTFCNIIVRAVCPSLKLTERLREPSTDLLKRCPSRSIANVRPGHRPLPSNVDGSRVAIVSLFRDPVVRVASGYFHNLHDCRSLQTKYGFNEWDDVGLFRKPAVRRSVYGERGVNEAVLLEYATCVGACHTRMLLNSGCGDPRGALGAVRRDGARPLSLAEMPRAARSMVRRAIHLVRTTLAFVGTTELFRESMQAFGAFAAVPVVPRLDFENTRPSWADKALKEVAEAALANATLVDSLVYTAARERFAAFVRNCQA